MNFELRCECRQTPVIGLESGTVIYDRDGTNKGVTTGASRKCNMEGCRSHRVYVKWDDGKTTVPCMAGLEPYKDGWKISG